MDAKDGSLPFSASSIVGITYLGKLDTQQYFWMVSYFYDE